MRLIAENLGGERGGEAVFFGIGFALEAGQALVVTGPNGSGKSTLLRVVAGLLPKAGGRLLLEDGGDEFPSIASACH
ncbi:MAG: ATP-binding cassette domain-containing protein, partial [Mesorhizobium sp.]